MLPKSYRRKIVKLLNCNNYAFQNQMLEMILFASPQKATEVFGEVKANPFLNAKFMNSMYKGTLERFDKIRYCYNPDLSDKEALWVACNLVSLFSEKVKNYVALREKYEHEYLNGEYDKAMDVLTQIDTEVCVSLWSCGQRFLIRQLTMGLEGNKRELTELSKAVSHNYLAQAVLFFYSSMAETNLSFESYQTEASRYLSRLPAEILSRYLANKISFDAMLRLHDISLVVQIDCHCSIIDAYNSVEKYFPVCYKDEICMGTLDPQVYTFGGLFKNLEIVDSGESKPLSRQFSERREVYTMLENYTVGHYEIVLELARDYLTLHPTDMQIATIFCKSLILSNLPYPDTIQVEYIRHIYSIYSMDSNYREAVLALKQEAKKNHGLPLGHKMLSFLLRKHLLVGNELAIFSSSVSDTVIHPNFAQYLSGEQLCKFERTLHDFCPNAIALAVAEQNGRFDSANLRNIDNSRQIVSRARYLCRHEEYDEAYKVIVDFADAVGDKDAYMKERVDKILLAIYAGKRDHTLAIKLLVETYFINEFLFERLKNCEVYKLPKRIRNRTLQKELCYTVYLYLVDRGNINQQLVGYNNYLDINQFSNILDALSVLKNNQDSISIFFFENVCTLGLLKRDVTLRMLNISPEEARIHILSKLMEIVPSKKYASEINAILTSETIKENLNTINKSRINVDTDRILLANKDQWEESYKKYLALSEFSPLYVDFDPNEPKISELDAVSMQRLSTMRTTQETVVLNNIVKQIETACLFSVQYGLETYLSSRIRHGYCKGQLTSFLSELHLLSMRKSEESKEYFLNDYWNSKIDPNSVAYDVINKILTEFTKTIEGKINEILKSWLRIKHYTQEDGMFNYDAFATACCITYGNARIQDFAVFFNRIIEAFWAYTETILKSVQKRISEELTEFYLCAIDLVETRLQAIEDAPSAINELITNCKLAKAKVILVMRQFAEAFSVNYAPYNDFTMSDLTASCRRTIEKVHSESSKAKWVIDADDILEFRGRFFAPFVDILCIFLNNAIEHSGLDKIEQLQIRIEIQELGGQEAEELHELQSFCDAKQIFEMKVTNTLAATLSREALEEKLKTLFEAIRTGNDARELIQSEGGSGLYKLCNTAQYNVEASYMITYETDKNGISFSYCFVVDDLICKEDADDYIVN